jgi:hypothetical protein
MRSKGEGEEESIEHRAESREQRVESRESVNGTAHFYTIVVF